MNVVLRLMEAAVEFVWRGGGVGGGWGCWGVHSHFHVQPNYSVEVVLHCVVVGVVTTKNNQNIYNNISSITDPILTRL